MGESSTTYWVLSFLLVDVQEFIVILQGFDINQLATFFGRSDVLFSQVWKPSTRASTLPTYTCVGYLLSIRYQQQLHDPCAEDHNDRHCHLVELFQLGWYFGQCGFTEC